MLDAEDAGSRVNSMGRSDGFTRDFIDFRYIDVSPSGYAMLSVVSGMLATTTG